jgi:hypothetical protein
LNDVATFRAVTSALGTAAPEGSRTIPIIDAVVDCAGDTTVEIRKSRNAATHRKSGDWEDRREQIWRPMKYPFEDKIKAPGIE